LSLSEIHLLFLFEGFNFPQGKKFLHQMSFRFFGKIDKENNCFVRFCLIRKFWKFFESEIFTKILLTKKKFFCFQKAVFFVPNINHTEGNGDF